MTRDNVIAKFDAAYTAAEPEENYGSEEAMNAQNEAFDAAKAAGWDWQLDGQFTDWCLKATDLETIVEGKKRFMEATEVTK